MRPTCKYIQCSVTSHGTLALALTRVPYARMGTPRLRHRSDMKREGRLSSTLHCTWCAARGTPASSTWVGHRQHVHALRWHLTPGGVGSMRMR